MKKEAERKRKEWNGAPRLRPLTASLTTTGEPLLQTFTGHLSPIDAVTITPDGLAVTGCNCQVVELRNGRTTAVSTSSDQVRAVAVTSDGRRVISGLQDRSVRAWDLERAREPRTQSGMHASTS